MPTCGDCKKHVNGRCHDIHKDGTRVDIEVKSLGSICTDSFEKTGWGGFVPKEQPKPKRETCGDCAKHIDGFCTDTMGGKPMPKALVSASVSRCNGTGGWDGFVPKTPEKTLGQLLKEKLDAAVEENKTDEKPKQSCGTCKHCGEFESDGFAGCEHPWFPRARTVVKVRADHGSKCSSFELKVESKVERKCGNCEHYVDSKCISEENWKRQHPRPVTESFSMLEDWGTSCVCFSEKSHCNKTTPSVEKEQGSKAVHTTTKEISMSNAIIRLADTQLNKDIVELGGSNIGLSHDLKEALVELQAKDRKESAQAAATEVMALLKAAETMIEARVEEIQEARRQEAFAKKRISEVNKAKAYGLATNNFVPLGVLVGTVYSHHVHNQDLLKIDESKLPEGWDKKPEAK